MVTGVLLTFKPELRNIWSVFPLRLAPWKPSELSLAFTYLFRNYLLRFHVVPSAGEDSRDSSHETVCLSDTLVWFSFLLSSDPNSSQVPRILHQQGFSAPTLSPALYHASDQDLGIFQTDCHNCLFIGASSATVTALKCGCSLPHQSEPQTQLCRSSASAPPKLKSLPTPGKEYR